MYFVAFISIVAVVLTYFSTFPKYRIFFKVAFILLAFIGCIHCNYGTDYDNYYDMFQILKTYTISDISLFGDFFTEPGWAFINIVFSFFGDPIGFYILVVLLNILQNYIYYYFIKNYVSPNYRWLAVCIYVFSSTFYILNFSMMRQGLAISLILLSAILMVKNRYIFSILIWFLATLFHTSSIIFLPILLLSHIHFKHTKLLFGILWGLVVISFFASTFMNSLYTSVISMSFFEDYQGYEDFGETSVGVGFLINLIPYIVITYITCRQNIREDTFFVPMVVLMFFALIFTPFTFKVTLIGRMLYYFSVFSIVVIPNVYGMVKNKIFRNGLIFVYLFMLFWDYLSFFNPSYWAYQDYKTFHTIFEFI